MSRIVSSSLLSHEEEAFARISLRRRPAKPKLALSPRGAVTKHQAKAIAFDFDGVIALSEHVHAKAWKDLEQDHGGEPLPEGFLAFGVGRTDKELAEHLATAWGASTSWADLLQRKRNFYQRRCGAETQLVPGVARFIREVSKLLPIAVATSSSRHDIAPVLTANALDGYFRVRLTIESISRPKPDPEIYLLAAGRLGVSPHELAVFEDSPTGVAAAMAAGAMIIGLTTSFERQKLPGPMSYINDFIDIEHIKALLSIVSR